VTESLESEKQSLPGELRNRVRLEKFREGDIQNRRDCGNPELITPLQKQQKEKGEKVWEGKVLKSSYFKKKSRHKDKEVGRKNREENMESRSRSVDRESGGPPQRKADILRPV